MLALHSFFQLNQLTEGIHTSQFNKSDFAMTSVSQSSHCSVFFFFFIYVAGSLFLCQIDANLTFPPSVFIRTSCPEILLYITSISHPHTSSTMLLFTLSPLPVSRLSRRIFLYDFFDYDTV